MRIEPGFFPDVADALGIDSPAIVEKDVYAVQLLSLLSGLRSETFELVFAGGTVAFPVSSLYADIRELPPEVASFPVISLHATISEKLVALLRRTAHVNRDSSRKDDETLVRHVYDLHMVTSSGYDVAALRILVREVIQTDAAQFGTQHTHFLADPVAELLHGLECLRTHPIHQARYERFIGPLVYHEAPASWDEALQTVIKLAHQLL